MTRTLPVRRLAAVAAPLLLAASLTACGGGASGSPEDASKEDFCEAYSAEPDLDESLADASPEEQAKAIKEELDKLADRFEEVGTPEDIPDDARAGFEASIDAANDISEDDIKTAIEDEDSEFFDNVLDGDDAENSEAFGDWADDYCGDSSDAPSDTES